MSIIESCGTITCITTGKTYPKEQFKQFVEEKKIILISKGVRPQERVLLLNNNTADFLAMLFAIWSIDATALPADSKIKGHGYFDFIKDYDVRFVYDGYSLESTFINPSKLDNPQEQIDLILLSSGTTGISKGIGFNKKNIFNRTQAIHENYGQDSERTLCLLPTSFGHGLIANTLAHFLSGKHVFLSPKFDLGVALHLGRTIDDFSITNFSSVPALWNLLMASKASPPKKSSLQQVHCASSFLFSETYTYARSWITDAKFIVNYGLTECGSWVSGGELPHDASLYQVGFVGKPIDCRIEIKNPDATGNGMVTVFSESIPSKYVGRIQKKICDSSDNGLETGDIGNTKSGFLFLTGRVSDFINQGGEKVSPLDIEIPAQSYPGVLRAAAVPVEHNILGEQIGLVVETSAPENFEVNDLKTHLSKLLPASKLPKIIVATNRIPLNENLKIDRLQIKKHFERLLTKKK